MSVLPPEIHIEVVRWQERLRWPDLVPAWAEFPDKDGELMFCRYQELTVALCEQATEHHVRRAKDLLRLWNRFHRPGMARAIGRHVLWARIYRCRFIQLTGTSNSTEADMPFSFGKF